VQCIGTSGFKVDEDEMFEMFRYHVGQFSHVKVDGMTTGSG
jgi:hypothetical protein